MSQKMIRVKSVKINATKKICEHLSDYVNRCPEMYTEGVNLVDLCNYDHKDLEGIKLIEVSLSKFKSKKWRATPANISRSGIPFFDAHK